MHYIPLADSVIALENGRIAHQGAYGELVASGYDLTGTLARSPLGQQVAKNSPTKGTGDQSKEASKSSTEKDAEEDDEALKSYDKGGLIAYKFYAKQAGHFRLLLVALYVALYSATRLGLQVSNCPYFFTRENKDTIIFSPGLSGRVVAIQRKISGRMDGRLRSF